jgi:hypothetical protein
VAAVVVTASYVPLRTGRRTKPWLKAAELVAAGLAPDEEVEDEAGFWPLTLG